MFSGGAGMRSCDGPRRDGSGREGLFLTYFSIKRLVSLRFVSVLNYCRDVSWNCFWDVYIMKFFLGVGLTSPEFESRLGTAFVVEGWPNIRSLFILVLK
jgi:hypothetical protein